MADLLNRGDNEVRLKDAAGNSLDKQEDTASTTGDYGVFILGVRNSGLADLTDTDGDYSAIAVDSKGRLILSAGISVSAASEFDEDTAHATGNKGTFVLAVRNDTNQTLTDTDGDYSPVAVDLIGRLKAIVERITPGTDPTNLGKADGALHSFGASNFSLTRLPDPATLPAGAGSDAAFSYDGNYMAVAHNVSPFITIYKRAGDAWTKLADPATLPAFNGKGLSFSADGTYLAVGHTSSPFISIYKRAGDVFTKLADPAALPTGQGNDVAFSLDGTYLSVVHATSRYVTIYKRAGDVFTKLADPATLPTGQGVGTAFSPDGNYLSVAQDITPFVTIYKRAGDVFTKLANPAVLPAGIGRATAFSPDGAQLAVTHSTSPYITVYNRSGDVFTKIDIASLPPGECYGVCYSLDGTHMVLSHGNTPYLAVYKRASGLYTRLSDAYVPPTALSIGLAFSTDGVYMVVAQTATPFVVTYKTNGAATVATGVLGLGVRNDSTGDLSPVDYSYTPKAVDAAGRPRSVVERVVPGTSVVDLAKKTGNKHMGEQNFSYVENGVRPVPPGTGTDVTFSSDGVYMAAALAVSPFVAIYKRAGDAWNKLPDPATLPAGIGNGVSFSEDVTYLAVTHNTSPFVTIYKRTGDVFTKLANPAVLPPSTGVGVRFSDSGTYLAVGCDTSPYVVIYKVAGDVFTKLADPAALPAGPVYGMRWNSLTSQDLYLATAHSNSPFVTIYKRAGDVFTKLANPAVLPAGNAYDCAFGSDYSGIQTYLAVAHETTPFVTIYRMSAADTFTKVANPAVLPVAGGAGYSVAFSPDGKFLAVGDYLRSNTNRPGSLLIYKRTQTTNGGDTFTWQPIQDVTPEFVLPSYSNSVLALEFSRDSKFLVAGVGGTAPYVMVYQVGAASGTLALAVRQDEPNAVSLPGAYTPLLADALGRLFGRTITEQDARALLDQAFIASTDQVTLAAAGQFRATIENPAASGKSLVIWALVSVSTAGGTTFAGIYMDPTTGLPAASKTPRSLILNRNTASVALVKADTNLTTALGGGTKLFDMPVPSGRQTHNEALFVIEQGHIAGFNVPFAGAASGQLILYYWEMPPQTAITDFS